MLTHQKLIIDSVAKEVSARYGLCLLYTVGTMIELPRAALIASSIAEEAEFFGFGTNDLTQTTFGMSRDDSARFIPRYVHRVPRPTSDGENIRILPDDPFQTLDVEGGRKTRPKLKCGLCGEHGGDPRSIILSYQIGVNYVSCSPLPPTNSTLSRRSCLHRTCLILELSCLFCLPQLEAKRAMPSILNNYYARLVFLFYPNQFLIKNDGLRSISRRLRFKQCYLHRILKYKNSRQSFRNQVDACVKSRDRIQHHF
ncbi:MAG: putative PEP-binding protein [Chlamydiales bacterium]|nr:putative PEP-binding protein [Chlamydiales bacterium]